MNPAQAAQKEQYAPCADSCAAGRKHQMTASSSCQTQGSAVPPAQEKKTEHPAAPKGKHTVSGVHLTVPLSASPAYKRSFLAVPTPPYTSPQCPGVLHAQRPVATRSEPRAHGPQPGQSVKPGHPVVSSHPRGCTGQGRPARGREGAARQERGAPASIPVPVPTGWTLVERGAARAGQDRALLTFPADHRSAVAGDRSGQCQPASGRATARPAPREPAEGPPPARLPPAPPPGAPRHRERSRCAVPGRGGSEPAGLPGRLGVRALPHGPRRARPARPPLPPRCGGPGPARRGVAARPPAPLPRTVTRWHGRAAHRRLPPGEAGAAREWERWRKQLCTTHPFGVCLPLLLIY